MIWNKSFKDIVLLLLLIFCTFAQSVQNNTRQHPAISPLPPPMGWNSWNWFGRNINEKLILETIDVFSKQGLHNAGYQYVVIDGGWRTNHLDKNGALIVDSNKFPHGIKYLADYAHNHGLKLGLHIVAGEQDCAKNWTGSKGHEALHLKQLLSWNIDFIKLDKCLINNDESWTEETSNYPYHRWGELLKPYTDKIFLSLSFYHYQDWYPLVGKTGRTTNDIKPKIFGGAVFDQQDSKEFLSVMEIAEINNRFASKAGHGYWNDPDMLVVGDTNLSVEEQKAHFALWCIMTAPLMLGNDLRKLSAEVKTSF